MFEYQAFFYGWMLNTVYQSGQVIMRSAKMTLFGSPVHHPVGQQLHWLIETK